MSESKSTLPALAVSRALLATAPGRRKLDLIFDAEDPKAFVRRLPAEDLYFALREIGLEDASQVIGLATPAQFRAFVDLDAWDRDLPSPARVVEWLRLAREGAESSVSLRRQRQGLDRELLLLVLSTQTRVHPLEENEPDPVFESNDFIRTAEGKYIIEILDGAEDAGIVRWLIEDLIDESPFEATRLFEAVRWEVQSELEETSLRWRNGRMRDIGFPEPEEAMQIWKPLPAAWKPRESAPEFGSISGVPALLLSGSRQRLLLDRVAEKLPDEARTHFNEGLLYLLNCAIVADGVEPRDLDLARPSIEAARDMLSLGLELASGGNEDLALGILSATPATELFRLAATEVTQLGREASRLVRLLPPSLSPSTLLDASEGELLSGLRRRRPRLYDPPAEGEKRAGGLYRALRDRQDLQRVREGLLLAETALQVASRLGLDTLSEIAAAANRAPSAVSLTQLVLTGAARTLLGLAPSAEPLAALQVEALGESFAEGRLKSAARTRLEPYLAFLGQELPGTQKIAFETLSARWLARLETELGVPSASGPLDARFVDAVLSRPA